MSFLDHVRHCNAYSLADFVPFRVGSARVGWIRRPLTLELMRFGSLFHVFEDLVHLNPDLRTAEERTEAVDQALSALRGDGLVGRLRGERYAVMERPGTEVLIEMDRGAVTQFGIVNLGFHLTGVVGHGPDTRMWIARRALDKTTYPGHLDNMVAGGHPAGLTPRQNLLKECAEEAGIPEALAESAVPVSMISYTMEVPEGLRRHAFWSYDLQVPVEFTPEPVDGEVDSFTLMDIDDVACIVETSDAFKYNCNLVVIDWLMRTGRIDPAHPDFHELSVGLHQPWP
ncbi:MutT/nudix family protein [alpha proteobacterium BAL199]|nr:MutT/nudix family protein [alpha proteobacterium BAL199]